MAAPEAVGGIALALGGAPPLRAANRELLLAPFQGSAGESIG
jgi:hypothetical protein